MLNILHLSDIHFGKLLPHQIRKGASHSAHMFVDSKSDEPEPNKLADILKREFDSQWPHAAIVSGDIGWSGSDEDYKYALKFFETLKNQWKNTRFIIAPGNHDILLSENESRQQYFIKFLREFYGDDFEKYYPILNPSPTSDADSSMLVAFHQLDISQDVSTSEQLFIVAANSAAFIKKYKDEERDRDGTPVFIPPDVLQKIGDRIRLMKLSPRTLRLFVLHHHLFPFAEPNWRNVSDPSQVPDQPDPTIVANSAKLQAWLAEQSFRIVLHGHKHISHSREDVLWRRSDPPEGRRLLIIGAGSAGVEQHHRSHQEPLSYNLLTINRLSQEKWRINVSVNQIDESGALPKISKQYVYSTDVGVNPGELPLVFHTEFMDDCHRIIKEYSEKQGLLRNFISIVEDSEYKHPSTVRIGNRTVTREEVDSSFRALHPEYTPSEQWTELSQLEVVLEKLSPRFHFQHGPRLFRLPNSGSPLKNNSREYSRPIERAMESLKRTAKSHAYVGLYRPEIDALNNRAEPLPALASVQFVPSDDDRYLDVIATFRKVELSLWWVVNMYEIGALLRWAAKYDSPKRIPRRITFFAALAEWKENPDPTFITVLDQMNTEALTILLINIEILNDRQSVLTLASLLEEKKQHTNENNLDATGLDNLIPLLKAFLSRPKRSRKSLLSKKLLKKLCEANQNINEATAQAGRNPFIEKAYKALEEAVDLLKGA